MKFLLFLASLLPAVSAITEITASSPLAKKLMSSARKLEENEEFSSAWISSYSIKFQGCHHIKQWNGDADGDEDVKISTTRLVRFRLCPTDQCSSSKAAGCTAGYGDYIIDMATFMQSYFEIKQENDEYECAHHLNTVCGGCADNGDDGFNEDYCQYDCWIAAGMTQCIEDNPYVEDEEVQEFNLEDYMECKELEVQNNNGRRKLNEEVKYYVGPYCANQGGSIYLGVFSDESCTEYATDVSFETLAGYPLPYSTVSIVGEECMGCLEREEEEQDQNNNNNNNNNGNDAEDEDQVIEQCEELYLGAGKCESTLPEGTVTTVNNNACNYMQGIRIVRQDGIIGTSSTRPSAVATAFIVIFAMAFCAMAFYVWYLRTRLGVKKNTLL